ncbi:unnamed protein product [Paramecium sonneborni]|uniref:Uncharacterized protein n=1 Tax=Paramecium sonneborni TaxID=65129 RepID=A0A8S1QI55_9CILI|nr:unnamed protein product [Paramecium sonneborni]
MKQMLKIQVHKESMKKSYSLPFNFLSNHLHSTTKILSYRSCILSVNLSQKKNYIQQITLQ